MRKANVLFARTAEACQLVAQSGGGFAVEQPEPREGRPSLFALPDFVELERRWGARRVSFDQCRLGAATTKPTTVWFHRGGFILGFKVLFLRRRPLLSPPPPCQTIARSLA